MRSHNSGGRHGRGGWRDYNHNYPNHNRLFWGRYTSFATNLPIDFRTRSGVASLVPQVGRDMGAVLLLAGHTADHSRDAWGFGTHTPFSIGFGPTFFHGTIPVADMGVSYLMDASPVHAGAFFLANQVHGSSFSGVLTPGMSGNIAGSNIGGAPSWVPWS